MERDLIVTLNAGSSSLRCAVFERRQGGPEARLRRSLRGLPGAMIWAREDARTGETAAEDLAPPGDSDQAQAAALAEMKARLLAEVAPGRITAFSHRVVHGGRDHARPVRVTDAVLESLAALAPLAPSHQPHNLAAIRDLARDFPDVPQVACFDTAFVTALGKGRWTAQPSCPPTASYPATRSSSSRVIASCRLRR